MKKKEKARDHLMKAMKLDPDLIKKYFLKNPEKTLLSDAEKFLNEHGKLGRDIFKIKVDRKDAKNNTIDFHLTIRFPEKITGVFIEKKSKEKKADNNNQENDVSKAKKCIKAIYNIHGIEEILVKNYSINVVKSPIFKWRIIEPQVLKFLRKYLEEINCSNEKAHESNDS